MFRINSKQFDPCKSHRVFLFVHPLTDAADCWVYRNDETLAKKLADMGHDIWLLNNRGNKYSCYHEELDNESRQFWDFSFQEMADYDMPASVSYIYKETQTNMTLIGFSQGTTQIFGMLSDRSDLHEHIIQVHAIAPIPFLNAFSKDKSLAYYLAYSHIFETLQLLGVGGILHGPVIKGPISNQIIKAFCVDYDFICRLIFTHFTDKNFDVIDKVEFMKYLHTAPSRVSVKTITHYLQWIRDDKPITYRYNYGPIGNLRKYGQLKTPTWNLKKIKVPIYLYHGENDFLSNQTTVDHLEKILHYPKTRIFLEWGHLSFILATDLAKLDKLIIKDIFTDTPNNMVIS